MNKNHTLLFRLVPLAVLLVGTVLLYLGRSLLPMGPNYAFNSVAYAGFGAGGQTLVIDQGRKTLELLDPGPVLVRAVPGENVEGFYYADLAAQDGERLYIADNAYVSAQSGTDAVTRHVSRVVELTGNTQRVVWQGTAGGGGKNAGKVFEVQVYNEQIYFLLGTDYGLELYRFQPGGAPQLERRYYVGDVLNGASVDLDTGTAAIAARRGYVRVQTRNSGAWVTLESDAPHLMPQSITARGGQVWFTDLYANRICRFDPLAPDAPETVCTTEVPPVSVSAAPDGSALLVSVASGFLRLENGAVVQVDQARFASFPLTVCLWVLAAVTGLALLLMLLGMTARFAALFRNESALRVLFVVLAAATVAGFIGYTLLSEHFQQEDDTLIEGMHLFADIASDNVDTAALARVRGERDYGGSAYTAVSEPLTRMVSLAEAEGRSYHGALYTLDGETLRVLCTTDDDAICGEPYAGPDAEYATRTLRTGNSYALRTWDEEGTWLALLVPVAGRDGTPAAALKLTMDMGFHDRQRREATFGTLLNVVCTTAVVVMLILEAVFLLSFYEKRRRLSTDKNDAPTQVPVRTMMFFSYLADSMQDVFIAVLISQLYRGGLPIPDSVAVALPMSGQLLAMALSSLFSGRAAERLGVRRMMLGGVTVQLAGFLCCLLTGNYAGILIGKLLIGVGVGAVYVTCNTVAASGATEESVGQAFAGVSAGSLAGVTIGAGLASVFLTIGGWRVVYGVGCVVLIMAFFVALSFGNVRLLAAGTQSARGGGEGFRRFFLNRRVPGFFLLILVPFYISLSYREYFFPLFAEEHGFSEVRVGQIYLLFGLFVIYVGPQLSAWLLRRLGTLWSVIAANGLMALSMLLFVVSPTVLAVVAGIFILHIVLSFVYTCQYTYFGQLPETQAFGEGRSMGVYSGFESLGQTMGPIVYGSLLTLGYRPGIGILCAALFGLAGAFRFLAGRNGENSPQ